MVFTCVQANADTAPTVMLSHNGVTTLYKYYQVQNAVDDAVEGDTIFLSEGTFQPFNVNKRIMVRGAGETTIIEGNCEIDISGEEKLTMPVLDAMVFNGDVKVISAYKQFTLRKCQMSNLMWDDTHEFYDTKFDLCYVTNWLHLPVNVKELNAFNSKFQVLRPYDYEQGEVTFEHCNIYEICDTIRGAVFNSCYVRSCTKFSGAASNCNLIGCVLNSCVYRKYDSFLGRAGLSWYNCTIINCSDLGSSDYTVDFGSDKYISAIDGTCIGIWGGQHPFSLWPEVPGVTKYNLSIDAATKTMTVKLTVDKLAK